MYQPISSLQLPDFKVQELQTAGYYYCKDVDVSQGSFKSKVSIPQWNELISVPKTRSALDVYQDECISGTILTFNRELDEALRGGIPVGLITEFCGEPGSGKTQLCFHLCINVQLPVWCGGMAGEAVYIGTNKGFASHRIREIATAFVNHCNTLKSTHCPQNQDRSNEFSVESIMKKINYMSVDDHVELIAATKYLERWLEEHSSVHLLVIDSISAALKSVSSQERTAVIYRIFRDLQQLAQKYRFAIVVTNDITTRVLSANTGYHTPALGGSYYHRINIRVMLSKKSADVFRASVIKNVWQAPSDIEFKFMS